MTGREQRLEGRERVLACMMDKALKEHFKQEFTFSQVSQESMQ